MHELLTKPIKVRRLVPIIYSKPFRDTGRYDSSERLPDIDLLLDRTLAGYSAIVMMLALPA